MGSHFPLIISSKMKTFLLILLACLASLAVVESQFNLDIGTGLGLLALKGLLLKGAAIGYLGSQQSSNRRHHGGGRRGYRNSYRKSYNNHGHHSSHGYGNSHSQGYGGYSRWRRNVKGDEGELSLTPYQDLVFQAEFQDVDDCAKMFICQLGTKPEDNLDDIEQNIKNMFDGALDVTKSSVLFDLAATVGRDAGLEQCKTLYARCQMPYDEMLQFMSQKEGPTTILNNNL